MPTLIERCLALSRGVPGSSELERILALPRRILDLSQVPDLTPLFARGAMSLWPIQNAALLEIEAMEGGLFPIGAGHGKTLISLLAGEALEAERVVLLVPPSLRDQLTRVDIPRYLEAFKFRPPFVLAYSELSSEKGAHRLDELRPDLIVADEAHCLKLKRSVRTKRFLGYFRRRPETKFVALSGTFTNKSLRDYAHLAQLALGIRSPVPLSWNVLEDWCAALDPDVEFPAKPGALMRLCEEENHAHLSVRDRYRCRLVSSPGVVATAESAIGTSLVIRGRLPSSRNPSTVGRHDASQSERPDHERRPSGGHDRRDCDACPDVIREALRELRETWTRPDGEEIQDALTFSRIARQVAQGFYLRWQAPVDHEWFKARNAWHKEVRTYLSRNSTPGRDSPLLLARAAEMGTWKAESWPAWNAVKHLPPPPSEVVWLSDFLAEDAAKWLKGGGIVWVSHPALGERIAELAGVPFFGAGDDAILTCDARGIVASTHAHGTGKNLQRFSRMLFTHVPGAAAAEQAIARCHRPGQQADEVEVEIYLHTQEVRERWEKTLEEATYIEQSMGQRQKVLLATRIEC